MILSLKYGYKCNKWPCIITSYRIRIISHIEVGFAITDTIEEVRRLYGENLITIDTFYTENTTIRL